MKGVFLVGKVFRNPEFDCHSQALPPLWQDTVSQGGLGIHILVTVYYIQSVNKDHICQRPGLNVLLCLLQNNKP